jgi:hypothetical protein
MADTFTPPSLDSHQGPAPGAEFTPPPLSSHQGPAAAQAGAGQPGFWSRLGDAINPSNLVRAYADSLGSGNPFSGIVNAATTAGNAAITPGTNGQGATPFRAAVASVPIVGQMSEDVRQGNYKGAAGTLVGTLGLGAAMGALGGAADAEDLPAAGSRNAVPGGTLRGQISVQPAPSSAPAVPSPAWELAKTAVGVVSPRAAAIIRTVERLRDAVNARKGQVAAPEGAEATAPVSTPLPPQPEEGTPSPAPAPGTPVPMNRPLATTGTPSGYIPGEPPEVTAMRARLNGNGSAPTAQPPAPSTQNPAPYVAPDVPGALPGEPPAVTAMRQRLNGNGNGSAAPAPDSQAQAQLLDDIAKGQLGPKASFAKLSADQQDVVRRIAASMDPTPKAAGAVSRTVEPSGTVPAPSPAPSTQDPAPATVYPNVGKTQPGYEDTLGPGLNIFRVPINDVIPTENPYGLGKGAKVSEYGARIQNGETPPPLYGRYDPTKGGVVLGDGNTRLAALRNTGAQTVDVATSNPKGFEAAPAPAAPAPAAPPTQEEMAAPFKIDQSAYETAQQARQAAGEAKHSRAADAWATEMANRLFANKVTPQDYQLLAPNYDPKGIDSSLDILARNNGNSMITPASKLSANTLLKTFFRLQTLWNDSRPAAAPPFGQSGILTPK